MRVLRRSWAALVILVAAAAAAWRWHERAISPLLPPVLEWPVMSREYDETRGTVLAPAGDALMLLHDWRRPSPTNARLCRARRVPDGTFDAALVCRPLPAPLPERHSLGLLDGAEPPVIAASPADRDSRVQGFEAYSGKEIDLRPSPAGLLSPRPSHALVNAADVMPGQGFNVVTASVLGDWLVGSDGIARRLNPDRTEMPEAVDFGRIEAPRGFHVEARVCGNASAGAAVMGLELDGMDNPNPFEPRVVSPVSSFPVVLAFLTKGAWSRPVHHSLQRSGVSGWSCTAGATGIQLVESTSSSIRRLRCTPDGCSADEARVPLDGVLLFESLGNTLSILRVRDDGALVMRTAEFHALGGTADRVLVAALPGEDPSEWTASTKLVTDEAALVLLGRGNAFYGLEITRDGRAVLLRTDR